MAGRNEVDMLNGKLAGKILKVAIPLAAISMLQQLFNAADTAVVGRFGSATSLAAVGANVTIVNLLLTFFTGLSAGGSVCLSNIIGRGAKEKISDAVHTLVTVSLISAVIVVIVGQLLARPLLKLMSTPENILDQAELYLRIYLFAMMFAVIYNFASAILRSKGDTKRPLYSLIAAGILNVILNLFFVIVLKLDVAGVALATLISNALNACLTLSFLMHEEGPMRLSFKKLGIRKEYLIFTLRIGLPTGIQGMMFSVSNMVIQSGINSFGADCIAGNTAAANYEYITYFVVNAFGNTATTFIGQNYGAGKLDRCRKTFWHSLFMSIGFSLGVGLIFLFGSRFFLGIFTDSKEVYHYAYIRMCAVVVLEFLTSFNEMAAGGLRGRGEAMAPTIITILGSCVLRIIWINTVFRFSGTILSLMIVYPVSWILLAIAMLTAYGIRINREKKRGTDL